MWLCRTECREIDLHCRHGSAYGSGSVVMVLPRWYFRVQKQPDNISTIAVKPSNWDLSLGRGKSDARPGFRGEYGRASLYIHV